MIKFFPGLVFLLFCWLFFHQYADRTLIYCGIESEKYIFFSWLANIVTIEWWIMRVNDVAKTGRKKRKCACIMNDSSLNLWVCETGAIIFYQKKWCNSRTAYIAVTISPKKSPFPSGCIVFLSSLHRNHCMSRMVFVVVVVHSYGENDVRLVFC